MSSPMNMSLRLFVGVLAAACTNPPDRVEINDVSVTSLVPRAVDAGASAPETFDDKVAVIMRKFTKEQIVDMIYRMPLSDHRPESQATMDMLLAAHNKLTRTDKTTIADQINRSVNEALK